MMWFYHGPSRVRWQSTLRGSRSGLANKDTRGIPGTGKFCLRRVLVDGSVSRLSVYAWSLQSMQLDISDFARATCRSSEAMPPPWDSLLACYAVRAGLA